MEYGHVGKIKPAPLSGAASFKKEVLFCFLLTIIGPSLFYVAASTSNWGLRAVAIIILSFIAIQSALAFHDCLHYSISKKPLINVWYGRIIGAIYLWPFSFLKESHLSHHQYGGTIWKDTELLHLRKEVAEKRFLGELLAFVARTPLAPVLYAPLLQLSFFIPWIKHCWREPSKLELEKLIVDLSLMLVVWVPVCLYLASQNLLFEGVIYGFIVPYLLGLSMMYLITYPLHTLMSTEDLSGLSPRKRVFYYSRTFDTNKLIRLLFCNLTYHIEHHLYPSVNRWNLHSFSQSIRSNIIAYCRRHDLPLIVHKGYSEWYLLRHFKIERYNSISSREELEQRNAIFKHRLRVWD